MTTTTIQRGKCPHGCTYGGEPYDGPLVAMAAPFTKCQCCLDIQFYIDSGTYTQKGSWGSTWSQGLCGRCGGHYTEWDTRKGDSEQ